MTCLADRFRIIVALIDKHTAAELDRLRAELARLARAAIIVKVLLEDGSSYIQKQQWKSVFTELYDAIPKVDTAQRLIVPEPTDEDKKLIAGLETHAKAGKHTAGASEEILNYLTHVLRNFPPLDAHYSAVVEKLTSIIDRHTAANCDHLIAMNKGLNALNDKLQAEKAELVEKAKNLCDDFGDNKSYDSYRSKLVDELRTAIANATEKQKEESSGKN